MIRILLRQKMHKSVKPKTHDSIQIRNGKMGVIENRYSNQIWLKTLIKMVWAAEQLSSSVLYTPFNDVSL